MLNGWTSGKILTSVRRLFKLYLPVSKFCKKCSKHSQVLKHFFSSRTILQKFLWKGFSGCVRIQFIVQELNSLAILNVIIWLIFRQNQWFLHFPLILSLITILVFHFFNYEIYFFSIFTFYQKVMISQVKNLCSEV